MSVTAHTAEQPSSESPEEGACPASGDVVAETLAGLAGVSTVEPVHEELLEAAGEEETAEEVRQVAPGPAAPTPAPTGKRLEAPTLPPASSEAHGRKRRRATQNLANAEGLEAIRKVLERALACGLTPDELEALVLKVASERARNAGRRREAVEAAQQWEHTARLALGSVRASPPEVRDAETEPADAGGAPAPAAAPATPTPTPTPAPPPPKLVRGQPVERVATAAEQMVFVLESLAKLTAGKKLDLTKPVERVLFADDPELRRVVRGDPVGNLLTSMAVARAAKTPAGEPVESPWWEVGACVVALGAAVLPESGEVLGRIVSVAQRGSVGAAKVVRRLVSGLVPRAKR